MNQLPDDVRSFLEEIAGPEDLAVLERQAASFEGSANLNEEWMAKTAVQARRLLDRYAGGTP